MDSTLPLFPPAASTLAGRVDLLYLALVATAAFFAALIFVLVTVFAVRYRRRSDGERPAAIASSSRLEALWSLVPLVICLGFYLGGARLYFSEARAPHGSLEVMAVGKQWMWKFQHPGGQREINELHVPLGQPVRVTLASEDVIHSLYVPAFRVKQDAVPGRLSQLWFQATRAGVYHLFCAEYCGTQHSGMVGRVVVMEPFAYQEWLRRGGGTLADSSRVGGPHPGERRMAELGCWSCHLRDDPERGPALAGDFGREVRLQGGGQARVDAGYIRESILRPAARVRAGYRPLMPTYQGLVGEEAILEIVSYLRQLGPDAVPPAAGAAEPAPVQTSPPAPTAASAAAAPGAAGTGVAR